MEDTSQDGYSPPRALLIIVSLAVLLVIALVLAFANKWWPAFRQPTLPDVAVITAGLQASVTQASPTTTTTASPTRPAPASPIPRLTVTPPANGLVITLTARADAIGWASDLDGRSHFNMPNIHVGSFEEHIYYGLAQFDLSAVPPGSTIGYAALELVGLDGSRLGQGGGWRLNILDANVDEEWADISFEGLATATVAASLPLNMETNRLGAGSANRFVFDQAALSVLTQRLGNGVVSLLLEGQAPDENNLFSWDSGYGRHTDSSRMPVLSLAVVPPAIGPEGASPLVIVTSTPTAENIITVAALAAEATASAARAGTATAVPENWVTPIIITPQPAPRNSATALFGQREATARAFLYGTATPTPFNVWTATPTATPPAAPGSSSPEPAGAGDSPSVNDTQGSLPVRSPTPVPTATATPIFILLDGEVATPWASPPTPMPTTVPTSLPAELVGKIAFLSNRSGGPQPSANPLVYLIDPDGSNLAVLTGRTFYDAAIARDSFSSDQRFRVFVKGALRFDNVQVPALYFYDYYYNVEEQITHFGVGIPWDPAWSPVDERIAFVCNESNNDEIAVINRDGAQYGQLTESNEAYNAREIGKDTFLPEVNGLPSWSPDGSQIVFWSNRSRNRQIWVMDADGSNLYSLSTTSHDDWNPVWIKYTDPARDPVPDIQLSR